MNKETIEVKRFKKHWKGYGLLNNPYDYYKDRDNLTEVLAKLIEWSQWTENSYKKIYRHKLYSVEEDKGDGLAYNSKTNKWTNRVGEQPKFDYDIKFVDLVYYLDIYWQ